MALDHHIQYASYKASLDMVTVYNLTSVANGPLILYSDAYHKAEMPLFVCSSLPNPVRIWGLRGVRPSTRSGAWEQRR